MNSRRIAPWMALFVLILAPVRAGQEKPWVALFAAEGKPAGFVVREWNDLSQEAGADTAWSVKDGVLHSGSERGTWLVSEAEYGDFTLELEIRLTEVGNSGIALRAPMKGDPAFDGMEFQIADFRYNTEARPNELTGAIYRAAAPERQLYRPTEWNAIQLTLKGTRLTARLNGEQIQDIDLTRFDQPTLRHDGTNAPPLKDRPVRGHIGFQHLSRNNEPVLIRNVRIRELD